MIPLSLAAGARRGEEPAEDAGEQAAAAGQPPEDGGEDQGHTGGRECRGQWGRQGAGDSDILLPPPQVPLEQHAVSPISSGFLKLALETEHKAIFALSFL